MISLSYTSNMVEEVAHMTRLFPSAPLSASPPLLSPLSHFIGVASTIWPQLFLHQNDQLSSKHLYLHQVGHAIIDIFRTHTQSMQYSLICLTDTTESTPHTCFRTTLVNGPQELFSSEVDLLKGHAQAEVFVRSKFPMYI